MTDERILITGAAGSIGSELVRQLYKDNALYLVDNNETALFDILEELNLNGLVADIRDKDQMAHIFDQFRPTVIFHAAALKHVTPSMKNPRIYVATNLLGTLNLLELCVEYKVRRFVNISTDKAVQTTNVMGWTKRGTELFTQIYGGISVRFGNVLGSRGSVIPIWQKQIDQGKPLTVTDPKMERYMMTIEQAASLVITAATEGNPGDIYILDMGPKINVLELAKQIIGNRDIPIQTIGTRPGEVLSEAIMTPYEEKNAIKKEKFFVIPKIVDQESNTTRR